MAVSHRSLSCLLLAAVVWLGSVASSVAGELPWPPRLFRIAATESFSDPIQDFVELSDGRVLYVPRRAGSELPSDSSSAHDSLPQAARVEWPSTTVA